MLLPRVRRFALRHRLWRPDSRLVAAVSGGSDSVALLLLLHELHHRHELRLEAVAHLNHAIRADADDDEHFCRSLAERLQLPFISGRVDVPRLAHDTRRSLEVAGRTARRAFLEEARRARGADLVATAHTEDDQAETVLLRLVRGAGRQGMGGIRPRTGRVVRPLLAVSRDDLRTELTKRQQPWREDATNFDVSNPRNRVRHQLLPLLARDFNPSVRQALARFAEVARADEAWMSREADAATFAAVSVSDDGVRVDVPALRRLPEALARRVARNALAMAGLRGQAALHHVEAVRGVILGERSAHVLPGLRMEHCDRYVVLVREDGARQAGQAFCVELTVPGEVVLEDAGVIATARGPMPASQIAGMPMGRGTGNQVHVAADGLAVPLVVRSRRPGDWLRPLGLGGRKKVQDVLVDRKVRREMRDRVPLVTDARGHLIWVGGHVLDEAFRVTGFTKAVITLELRRA